LTPSPNVEKINSAKRDLGLGGPVRVDDLRADDKNEI
jgi:hypothetical protein